MTKPTLGAVVRETTFSEGSADMKASVTLACGSLLCRKLGEGEPLKEGVQYLMAQRGKQCGLMSFTGTDAFGTQVKGITYYELPPLTTEESEPVAAPAPNSVGERLTEAPEVGTPVVDFNVSCSGEICLLYRWSDGCRLNGDARPHKVYRWLGPIPEEPKEEKVEPPKWLNRESIIGAISAKGAGKWSRAFATQIDDPNGNGSPASVGVSFPTDEYPRSTWVSVFNATLITDDPEYPPSPELASLFAGEDKSNEQV